MEWIGWLCFILLILFYSSFPEKVKKLGNEVAQMKKFNKRKRGDMEMSKIISELIGKECIVRTEGAINFANQWEIQCTILDVDDEWIKLTYTDKKNVQKTQVLRIESIERVELIS